MENEVLVNKETQEELGRRFAKIEAGDYKSFSIEEVKAMLEARRLN